MKESKREKVVRLKSQGASVPMIAAKVKVSDKKVTQWIEEEVVFMKKMDFSDETINYYLNLKTTGVKAELTRGEIRLQKDLRQVFVKTEKQEAKAWKKKCAAMLLRSGTTPKYISEVLGVSQATLSRWRKDLKTSVYTKEEEKRAFKELTNE